MLHVKKSAWEPPLGSSKAFPMEEFSLPPPLTQQRFDMVGRPYHQKKHSIQLLSINSGNRNMNQNQDKTFRCEICFGGMILLDGSEIRLYN